MPVASGEKVPWNLTPVNQTERKLEPGSSKGACPMGRRVTLTMIPSVLATAAEGGSEFLLTLDRKHILAAAEAVQEANLPIHILRPGDFVQQYYPRHEQFSSLPYPRG